MIKQDRDQHEEATEFIDVKNAHECATRICFYLVDDERPFVNKMIWKEIKDFVDNGILVTERPEGERSAINLLVDGMCVNEDVSSNSELSRLLGRMGADN